jgi:hypothetical protein
MSLSISRDAKHVIQQERANTIEVEAFPILDASEALLPSLFIFLFSQSAVGRVSNSLDGSDTFDEGSVQGVLWSDEFEHGAEEHGISAKPLYGLD